MPEYKDTFKGTAWYYARYREGYPDEFFELLKDRFSLSRNDRVLDLGCGTGQIAIRAADFVKEVIAMDPEPEMLEEAKKQAEQTGVNNIIWIPGGSEDLSEIPENRKDFKLVTIGTAYHWMDRERVLRELHPMISDGSGICIVANTSIWSMTRDEWQKAGRAVIEKYLGERRRAGSGYYDVESRRHEDFVRESAFRNVEEWSLKWDWSVTLDEVVGYLFSTSMANPNILGDKTEAFDNELRQVLTDIHPLGVFETEVDTHVILAWK